MKAQKAVSNYMASLMTLFFLIGANAQVSASPRLSDELQAKIRAEVIAKFQKDDDAMALITGGNWQDFLDCEGSEKTQIQCTYVLGTANCDNAPEGELRQEENSIKVMATNINNQIKIEIADKITRACE